MVIYFNASAPAAAGGCPDHAAGVCDFVGSGGSSSSLVGTLAWAIVMRSRMQGSLNPSPQKPFYNLSYYRYRSRPAGYDAGLDLADVGVPAPEAPDCNNELIACMPGPCLVWEYDYQYAGLKRFDGGTLPFEAAIPGTTTIPMLGTARCGPLFNTQYLAASHLGFDALESVHPATVSLATQKYLPTLLDREKQIYGLPTALAPAASGANLNPAWYYTGYGDPATAAQAELNRLFNIEPRAIPNACVGGTAPPFAPLSQRDPAQMDRPLTFPGTSGAPPGMQLDETVPVSQTLNFSSAAGDGMHDAWWTGNPRVQTFTSGSDGVSVLTGYARGSDDRIDGLSGAELDPPFYSALDSEGNPLPRPYRIHGHYNYSNGLGVNHEITPHERPSAWTPDMCDFTQCRWVPTPTLGRRLLPHLRNTRGGCATLDRADHDKDFESSEAREDLEEIDKLSSDYAAPSLVACLATEIAGVGECDETARLRCYGTRATLGEAPLVHDRNTRNLFFDSCFTNLTNATGDPSVCMANITNSTTDTWCCGMRDPAWSQLHYSDRIDTQCLAGYYNVTDGVVHSNGDLSPSAYMQKYGLRPYFTAALDDGKKNSKTKDDRSIATNAFLLALKNVTGSDGATGRCGSFYQRTAALEAFYVGDAHESYIDGTAHAGVPRPEYAEDYCRNMQWISPDAPGGAFGNNPHINDDSANMNLIPKAHDNFVQYTPPATTLPGRHENYVHCLRGSWAHPADSSGGGTYSNRVPFVTPLPSFDGDLGTDVGDRPSSYAGYLAVSAVALSRQLAYGQTKTYPVADNVPTSNDDDDFKSGIQLQFRGSPGFPKMQCVSDRDVRLMVVGDVWGRKTKEKKVTDHGDECKKHGNTTLTAKFLNLTGDGDAQTRGILVGIPNPAGGDDPAVRYNPLAAYKNEQRWVKPVANAARLSAFHNTQLKSNSFACDCGGIGIAWFHDDPPVGAEYGGETFKGFRWVVSGFAWKTKRVASSPAMGLYLPSSQATVALVERDFLWDAKANSNRNASDLNLTLDGAHMPGRERLPGMVFDGGRYAGPAGGTGGDVHLLYHRTFAKGSCLRWPYGQAPQMSFVSGHLAGAGDPYDPARCTRDDATGVYRCTYAEEAMLGYCETVLRNGTAASPSSALRADAPYQHCWADPNLPEARHEFCTRYSRSSQYLVWQRVLGDRGLDEVCNLSAKLCLVVPGSGHFGQLSTLLAKLGRDAAGVTILVTPFNLSTVEYFAGSGRLLSPVGHGYAAETRPTRALADGDDGVTGFSVDAGAFHHLTDLGTVGDLTLASLKAAIAKLADLAFAKAGTPAHTLGQCGEDEYGVASPTNAAGPVRCLLWSELFAPTYDPEILVAHAGITIESALDSFAGRPTPLHFSRPESLYKSRSSSKCTVFNVAAENVTIGPAVFDTTSCRNLDNMDMTPIVLAGRSVAGFRAGQVEVRGPVKTAIIFAGDDTNVARARNDVNTSDVAAVVVVNDSSVALRYHVAMARAYGSNANFTCLHAGQPVSCHVAIMPVAKESIAFCAATPAVHVTNLSHYVAEMGSGFLHSVYPLRVYRHEWQLFEFVFYLLVIVGSLATIGVLGYETRHIGLLDYDSKRADY